MRRTRRKKQNSIWSSGWFFMIFQSPKIGIIGKNRKIARCKEKQWGWVSKIPNWIVEWKKWKWHGKKMKFIGNLCVFHKTVHICAHGQAKVCTQPRLWQGSGGKNSTFEFLAQFLHACRKKWKDTREKKRNSIRSPKVLFFNFFNIETFKIKRKIRKKLETRWNFVDEFL